MPPRFIRSPWAIGIAALIAIAAIATGVVLLLPSGSRSAPVEDTYGDLTATATGTTESTRSPTPRSVTAPTTTEVPTPPVYISPIARLRIPILGVDAPVQQKGVDASNTMESPDGPENVAWYNFTAKPGLGAGNAVFSGHVDYINYGKAVFGDVSKLVEGDLIEVLLEDGTLVQFAVTASQSYSVADIPMEEVLASTSTESVTLITCEGQFSGGSYSHRLVVRATRTAVVPVAS